jgi:cobalt-zinc-cadmium efflux system outer membrane protein
MHLRRFHSLAILGLLIITYSISAQTTATARLSLADALARAKQQHPLLIAAKQRVAMAEGERLDAGFRLNPSINVSGENFPIGPVKDGFVFTRNIDWFVTWSQTFETGDKRALRLALAERGVETARAEAAAAERQIVYEVKSAYQQVSIARLRAELLRENGNNLKQLVSLNEIRVREGYTAEGDLIKVRLEAQRYDYQHRRSLLELERAKIGLLRAMGTASFEAADTAFDLVESLDFHPVEFAVSSLEEAAMRQPQIQAAQSRIEHAQALLRLEQAQARPDLNATFGYKRNGPDNALYGALSVPLPFYNRNQGRIARAEAAVAEAQAEWNHARNLVRAELAAARRAVESRRRQVETLQADFLLQADESRAVSLAAYREGAADLIVLLDAQRVRSQAQELYYEALYEYQLAVHELERAADIERLPVKTPGQTAARESSPQNRK